MQIGDHYDGGDRIDSIYTTLDGAQKAVAHALRSAPYNEREIEVWELQT